MIVNANALHIPLKDKSIQCCVTSPPYWGLRDYGEDDQLGLEQTPEEYVENMVAVFREVWRVLRDDGTLWLNLGDSYYNYRGAKDRPTKQTVANDDRHHISVPTKRNFLVDGLKEKDLVGIPWRVAFALQADGWYLRNDIIWHKPNPMPESVTDRCTKSHEYIFLLTKNARYYYDNDAIREEHLWASRDKRSEKRRVESNGKTATGQYATNAVGYHPKGRNKRTVWSITTKGYAGAHYATFPPELPEVCIKAGTKEGDFVLDPFVGSGTTCLVARDLGRESVGLDLSFDYLVNNAKVRLELDKLEYWQDRTPEVKGNYQGLPMFNETQ